MHTFGVDLLLHTTHPAVFDRAMTTVHCNGSDTDQTPDNIISPTVEQRIRQQDTSKPKGCQREASPERRGTTTGETSTASPLLQHSLQPLQVFSGILSHDESKNWDGRRRRRRGRFVWAWKWKSAEREGLTALGLGILSLILSVARLAFFLSFSLSVSLPSHHASRSCGKECLPGEYPLQ